MFDFISNILNKKRLAEKGMLQNGARPSQKKRSYLRNFLEFSPYVAFLMMLLILLTSVFVLTIPKGDNIGALLVEKQYAPQTIFADFDFAVIDKEKTAQLKKHQLASLPHIYDVNEERIADTTARLNSFIMEVGRRIELETKGLAYIPSPAAPAGKLVESLPKPVLDYFNSIFSNPELLKTFSSEFDLMLNLGVLPASVRESSSSNMLITVIDTHNRVRSPELISKFYTPSNAALKIAAKLPSPRTLPQGSEIEQQLPLVLARLFQQGNLVFDEGATAEQQKQAESKIKPVLIRVSKGQPVIEKNQMITANDVYLQQEYRKESLNRQEQTSFWFKISESLGLCIAILVFTGIYIYHIHPEVVSNNRSIWLIGLVIIFSLLTNRVFLSLFSFLSESENVSPELRFTFLPLALAGMVISVIYGMRSALYAGLFVSAVTAIAVENSFPVVVAGLMVSGISAFSVRYSTNYKSYFLHGFLSVSATTVVIASVFLWKQYPVKGMLEWALILPLSTGLITAIIAQILLFLLEALFDVTTNMSLLSFNDYNHPLLKRLQLEAPGTYNHSLVVSQLVDRAANEIHANPIRARVCALFHDIGKLSQPDYFIENNFSNNRHKELSPNMSSLVILNHVKEGMELARLYKLKRPFRDAIEQHHGTDIVSYFYQRAVELSGTGHVLKKEFQYPGPLPHDKEIVLIMLADCCEAAVRSLSKPDAVNITNTVDEIFQQKIRKGQLDNADLTFAELHTVRECFIKYLISMYHGRIPYPKEKEKYEDDLFLAAGQKIPPSANESSEKGS